VLAPLGLKRIKDFGDGGSCWGQSTEEFMVLKPADGKPATHANGGTISFEAPSRAAVAAFHKAALDLGGKDEGAVGPRGFCPTPMPATSATSTATSLPPTAARRSSANSRSRLQTDAGSTAPALNS
jgi:hypothetical protein